MEKILVTGSSGFIGKHTVSAFVDAGYYVLGVDIAPMTDEIENYKHYLIDINSDAFEQVFKENDIKYIIHLAANSSVPHSFKAPIEDAQANYLGTIRLCDFALRYGVKRILAASTAALYAHPRYLPVKETHPTNCLSPYAVTKLAMEYYLKLSGVPYTILRFSNVYGPGQNKKGESGVVSIFIDAMKRNDVVKIYGDGEQIRDFIYVKDVANAILQAISSESCENTIMNVSSMTPTTVNELFNILSEILHYEKNAVYEDARKGDIKASILDNTLAKNTFGLKICYNIQQGLSLTVK